jgi:hypothetical protein
MTTVIEDNFKDNFEDDPNYWGTDESDDNILKLKEPYIWEHLGIEEKIETLRDIVWKLLDRRDK